MTQVAGGLDFSGALIV